VRLGGHCFYLQARNEPDVYETSDLPEDDQAEFDAVRLCTTSGFLWTLTSLPDRPFPTPESHSNKWVCQPQPKWLWVTELAKALLGLQPPINNTRSEVSGIKTNKTPFQSPNYWAF
jgi:hypothetical protein